MRREAAPRSVVCAAALFFALVVRAAAAVYPLAASDRAVGAVADYVTGAEDNLADIARRFDLGYVELVAANPGVDPWQPGEGRQLVLPLQHLLPDAPRRGIVVNLAERRLFYFPPGRGTVETFPIGVAVAGLDSPSGTTRVVAKERNPTWIPPASIRAERPDLPRVVPPGPDNPLGAYALVLGWPNYLIHGTNKPDGVGRNVSHGCLHLYPEDIARLYREVPVGTPVRVVDEAVNLAWLGDTLFLEIHPDKTQADALDDGKPMMPDIPTDLTRRVLAAAGDRAGRIDWSVVGQTARERSGMPVAIVGPHEGSARLADR